MFNVHRSLCFTFFKRCVTFFLMGNLLKCLLRCGKSSHFAVIMGKKSKAQILNVVCIFSSSGSIGRVRQRVLSYKCSGKDSESFSLYTHKHIHMYCLLKTHTLAFTVIHIFPEGISAIRAEDERDSHTPTT